MQGHSSKIRDRVKAKNTARQKSQPELQAHQCIIRECALRIDGMKARRKIKFSQRDQQFLSRHTHTFKFRKLGREDVERSGPARGMQYQIEFSAPDFEALNRLCDISAKDGGKIIFERVEFALDVLAEDENEAKIILNSLIKSLCTTRRENVLAWKLKVFENTWYAKSSNAERNFAGYASRPFKLSKDKNQACAHLEFRIQYTKALQKAALSTIDQIIRFDAERFWQKRFSPLNVRLTAITETRFRTTNKHATHYISIRLIGKF